MRVDFSSSFPLSLPLSDEEVVFNMEERERKKGEGVNWTERTLLIS